MKKFLKNTINFFQNKFVQQLIIIGLIFIVFILIFKDCGTTTTDNEVSRLKQNIEYYKDSLYTVRNKNDELVYNRTVLFSKNDKLKNQNKTLYNEYKKFKNRVIYLSEINAELENEILNLSSDTDSIFVVTYPDGRNKIGWSYDTIYSKNNSRSIAGETIFSFIENDTIKIDEDNISVNINRDITRFNLFTGLEEDKDTGFLNIFVRTDHPNLNITGVDGAVIDPHKSEIIKSYFPPKRFGVGIQVGYGISINNNQMYLTPNVSVGLSYNIWNF